MSILAQSFVLEALQSEKSGNDFPVNFDDVWQEIGYTRKNNAKRALVKSGYDEGLDFIILPGSAQSLDNVTLLKNEQQDWGGWNEETIFLSIDCFKAFCMMARTEAGKEFRKYFIDVEHEYRKNLDRQFAAAIANSPANNTDYSITCWGVWRDSGIRNPYYVKRLILDYYDHQTVNRIVCVTQQTYEDLMENFRAMDGADISNLPPDKQRKFRAHSQQDKMNRREPQQRDPNYSYIQLNLFD